jgi:hypothetical protein
MFELGTYSDANKDIRVFGISRVSTSRIYDTINPDVTSTSDLGMRQSPGPDDVGYVYKIDDGTHLIDHRLLTLHDQI